MRRRLVVAPFVKNASVAAALLACPLMVQAASVKTVFSAENALYGAGYNIGQADGWIDDNLRSAIRKYQADDPELNTTGELDEPTLSALGIASSGARLMNGNTVASRDAARKALGLETLAVRPEPAPAPRPVVAAPEPVAEPEPAPRNKEAAPVKPEANVIASAEPRPEPLKQPEPEVTAAKVPAPEPAQIVQAQAEPEPTSQPITIVPTVRASSRDDQVTVAETDQPVKEKISVDVAGANIAEEPQPVVENMAEGETTGAAVSQKTVSADIPEDSQAAERRGNVMTKMFDFLFGWLV